MLQRHHEMLFLVFFITTFVVVISDDLLGVSYYFNEDHFDTFSDKLCVNSTQWDLVSYGRSEIVPPYDGRSLGIRSLRNSCTTSFPIVFIKGTLEVVVYLRTVSKYSGITISVIDDKDEVIASVRYQRWNKNFMPGWVVISIPIKTHTTGSVQISGQSLNTELVIVDSLRYEPDKSVNSQSEEETEIVINDQVDNTPQPNLSQDEFIFAFDRSGYDDLSEESSGDSEDEPGITEYPDTQTEDPDNSHEDPSPEENTSENGEFWNVFTITLVSVGAFTAVGLVGVGSYYLGMNKGISQNPPLDLEALEAPSAFIPRARSVFSGVTYDRFSRDN